MKRLLKNSFSTTTSYFITMILFGIFSYAFIALAKDNIYKWIPWYSGLFFLMFMSLTYSDFKKLAIKEKRPQYELNPKPVNGLIYGLIGEIPLIILTVIGVIMAYGSKINPEVQVVIKNVVKVILGPLYLIYSIPTNDILGFVLALICIPFLTMAGYTAGLYNIEIMLNIKKRYKMIKEILIAKFKIDND